MSGYGDDAGSVTYHEARGNTAWTNADEDARDIARQRGSDWIDNKYLRRFPGSKVGGRSQERAWPRTGAIDYAGEVIEEDEIPDEVINASYEAALRELVVPGSLSPDFDGSQKIKSQSSQVGSLKKDVTYFDIAGVATPPTFELIDNLIYNVLDPTIGTKSRTVFLKRS